MSSKEKKELGSWLVFGFVLPILAELIGAMLIVITESGAYAEGFAGIVIIVMLMIAVPLTLVANGIIVSRQLPDKMSYLRRGMILPALFIVVSLIYYTGFWDHQIHPLFPRVVEKIQTASSGRVGEDSFEAFYIVNGYTASSKDQTEIENYAREAYDRNDRQSSNYSPYDIKYYFVPRELYDPMDDAVNREGAAAVFQHLGTDESPTIKRVK